jgi:PAS domain S-box-containing protein
MSYRPDRTASRFRRPGARRSFSIALPFYRHPVFVVPVSALTVTVVILGISLIVRKRKHTAALQESELKFRRLTEAAFEGIAIHNRGIILDANQRLLDMFGYAYEEFVGKSVVEFSAPESYDLVWTKMHTESETMYEAACLKKGGAKILVEIIGKTIPHQEGIAHVIAVRDITERKEAERRLLEYQSQLQSLASQLSLTEERERRRMAEFLHEYIVQSLALCKIKLEGPAERAAPAEQAKSREEICALLDGMIRNTRSLTFELSPPILHELDFEDALEWLAEQMQEQHSIEVSFEDDGEPKPVTHDTRILLFHATRELLFNVVKHARASRAVLSVRRCDPNILLAVADDGAGFVPSQGRGLDTRKGGFGLFNIRERLAFIGGRMEIESKPGAGTKITLIAPISETVDPNPGGGS